MIIVIVYLIQYYTLSLYQDNNNFFHMVFGTTTFKCDNCCNKFVAPAAEWCATCFIAPMPCPSCNDRILSSKNFSSRYPYACCFIVLILLLIPSVFPVDIWYSYHVTKWIFSWRIQPHSLHSIRCTFIRSIVSLCPTGTLLISLYIYAARTDNLATFALWTAWFLFASLDIMNILVTFVLSFGTFLVANTKCMIQIAGIHITIL